MLIPYERVLRDKLAERVTLIEPDLRLIATEYAMPNARGTRGYIDILARDGHGSWVVIELKRSDNAARNALHEVTKYAELLRTERGLRHDRVRAIIVSTTWEELLVPVSNMARDWSHDLRGYKLVLTGGELERAEPVALLPFPQVPRVSAIQHVYYFTSPAQRDRVWQQIVNRAGEAGAADLLAADLRRPVGEEWRGPYPLGLYFAIGQLAEPASDGQREYEVLCHILNNVFGAGSESAGPGILRQIVEHQIWQIEGYRAAGGFTKRKPLTARDLLRDLNGDEEGAGQIQYTGSARTTNRTRWAAFRREYLTCLETNPDWRMLVQSWLDDIERDRADCDVVLQVYNPSDLLCSLLHGWPGNLTQHLPMVFGSAMTRPTRPGPHRVIKGALFWNGRPLADLSGSVAAYYREPLQWAAAQAVGDSRVIDDQLVRALGLQYILIEGIGHNPFNPLDNDQTNIWVVRRGRPQRLSPPFQELASDGWLAVQPLTAWLDHHADQVDHLVTTYRFELGFQPTQQAADTPVAPSPELLTDEPEQVVRTSPQNLIPETTQNDLPGCALPPESRVPADSLRRSLVAVADLALEEHRRTAGVYACLTGRASGHAAEWILDTLQEIHPGEEVVPREFQPMFQIAELTRTDAIVAMCYIIATKGIPMQIRYRAAAQLVHYCHDAGYTEARRLLPNVPWTWLPDELHKNCKWPQLLATYYIEDATAPMKTRRNAAAALAETTGVEIPVEP